MTFRRLCTSMMPVILAFVLLFTFATSFPQGVPVAPNAGPFGPPVNYGPPPNPGPVNYRPPPTVVQQYYGPPPNVMQTNYGPPPNIASPPNFAPPANFALPPNFVPPPNIGAPPQPFMSPVNSFVPPPQGYSNFGFGSFAQPQPQAAAAPAVRPAASTADLNQPIPHEAQHAASGYSQTVGNVEHEFEATGNGNGGIETSHSNHPPPSSSLYGPQDTPLLDAYYSRNGNSNSQPSSDIFGGMFGGTPGGNLVGAYVLKEYVF